MWPNDPSSATRPSRAFDCNQHAMAGDAAHKLGASLESPAASSNDSVILAVMTNPKPNHVRAILDSDGTIVNTDTNRPHLANLLEMEGWMSGIGLEHSVILIRKPLNLLGKLRIELPELRVGTVPHKSRQRPSRKSRMASSA